MDSYRMLPGFPGEAFPAQIPPVADSASRIASTANSLWADPRLVYAVAVAAVVLLAITIWLFRRAKRDGRGAGFVCLFLSLVLHGALILLVPYQAKPPGGSSTTDDAQDGGVQSISVSMFDADFETADAAGDDATATVQPLPIDEMEDLLADLGPLVAEPTVELEMPEPTPQADTSGLNEMTLDSPSIESLEAASELQNDVAQHLESALDGLLEAQEIPQIDPLEAAEMTLADLPTDPSLSEFPNPPSFDGTPAQAASTKDMVKPRATATAASAVVPGQKDADFANRVGSAKELALLQTGGDLQTEAAVKAALRYLTQTQRSDGAWDPRTTGAGEDRQPLGESRPGAGTRCESAITGLSLLALMGAGHTHTQGEYADNVYRGLAYLIGKQKVNGSLAGDATLYAATYSHSMASLAMCEAAVLTKDPSAIEAARRAIGFTTSMQHPVTGGWRYTRNDRGDLSQLGWQAMVLDAGRRAGIPIPQQHFDGVQRFVQSVSVGRGGIACYRPGESASRTMTAEALATRLLMGQRVPQRQIEEAEAYLLQEVPGAGRDNYYYWYYATLALHQLQDDAWKQWNAALKQRLLSTQNAEGSWSSGTYWGGYGGTVYTTSMATLCLESYYRHAVRK